MSYQSGLPTKKAFKEKFLADKASIYSTSVFHPDAPEGRLSDLPDATYNVAGPHDFHKWYATVKIKTVDGVKTARVT